MWHYNMIDQVRWSSNVCFVNLLITFQSTKWMNWINWMSRTKKEDDDDEDEKRRRKTLGANKFQMITTNCPSATFATFSSNWTTRLSFDSCNSLSCSFFLSSLNGIIAVIIIINDDNWQSNWSMLHRKRIWITITNRCREWMDEWKQFNDSF